MQTICSRSILQAPCIRCRARPGLAMCSSSLVCLSSYRSLHSATMGSLHIQIQTSIRYPLQYSGSPSLSPLGAGMLILAPLLHLVPSSMLLIPAIISILITREAWSPIGCGTVVAVGCDGESLGSSEADGRHLGEVGPLRVGVVPFVVIRCCRVFGQV